MSEEIDECVWCEMIGCGAPAYPYLFLYNFSCIREPYTTGEADKLVPKIQNVTFGWFKGSSVFLILPIGSLSP